MIKQKAGSNGSLSTREAEVRYQSPKTVVITGPSFGVDDFGRVSIGDNQFLWQMVDMIKGFGYTIDAVNEIPVADTGGNQLEPRGPHVEYDIIMSHP